MTVSLISILFDVVVAGLLVATIVYAIRLNRRLEQIRAQESEFADWISRFSDAARQAEAATIRLRAAGNESGATLGKTLEKAQALRDDLSFMIDRAEPLADRMSGVATARSAAARPVPVKPVAVPAAAEQDPWYPDPETELTLEQAIGAARAQR